MLTYIGILGGAIGLYGLIQRFGFGGGTPRDREQWSLMLIFGAATGAICFWYQTQNFWKSKLGLSETVCNRVAVVLVIAAIVAALLYFAFRKDAEKRATRGNTIFLAVGSVVAGILYVMCSF